MRTRFTPSARRQFLDAIESIQSENPSAAAGILESATSALTQLREFPESGHAVPEFPDLPHRELLVAPYRFFYRVVDDTVWIVAVWHGRQLPNEPDVDVRGRQAHGADASEESVD